MLQAQLLIKPQLIGMALILEPLEEQFGLTESIFS